jgi:hypothetical protein
MALNHNGATTGGGGDPSHGTLRDYLIRYRLAFCLFSGAVVASGIALNWNRLTAAGLLPVIAFLPCMVMMFMCMKHGTRGANKETKLPDETVPDRLPTSADPQQ